MKLFKLILFLLIAASITACSEIASKNIASENELVLSHASNTTSQKLSPDSTVIAFLKWYRENEDRLNRIPLLKGGLPDTATFYSVDFRATEQYLKEVKKSGYVSEIFLVSLRRHFVQSNDLLKQQPQNDGPAPGFDADLIMQSQDYMDIWENLDKAKALEKNTVDNKASVTLYFAGNYKTKYLLTKSGKSWLIDNIDNSIEEN